MTALATVWCLGCSGFEPLVSALFGGDAESDMVCTSGDGASQDLGSMSASDRSQAPEAAAGAAPAGGQAGFDCGCGQLCQAPSPTAQQVAPLASAAPHVEATTLTQPSSVVRTPLLPPPEQTA